MWKLDIWCKFWLDLILASYEKQILVPSSSHIFKYRLFFIQKYKLFNQFLQKRSTYFQSKGKQSLFVLFKDYLMWKMGKCIVVCQNFCSRGLHICWKINSTQRNHIASFSIFLYCVSFTRLSLCFWFYCSSTSTSRALEVLYIRNCFLYKHPADRNTYVLFNQYLETRSRKWSIANLASYFKQID